MDKSFPKHSTKLKSKCWNSVGAGILVPLSLSKGLCLSIFLSKMERTRRMDEKMDAQLKISGLIWKIFVWNVVLASTFPSRHYDLAGKQNSLPPRKRHKRKIESNQLKGLFLPFSRCLCGYYLMVFWFNFEIILEMNAVLKTFIFTAAGDTKKEEQWRKIQEEHLRARNSRTQLFLGWTRSILHMHFTQKLHDFLLDSQILVQ